jgi:flagellin
VTNLLTRAVTLATEASNGTLDTAQYTAADAEFQNIVTEINNIGATTNYNGNNVFSATAVNFVTTDGTSSGVNTFAVKVGALSNSKIGVTDTSATPGIDLSTAKLDNATDAATALTSVTGAISDVALQRGVLGADINQLTAASNVAATQNVNDVSAENSVLATDYGQASSNLSKYQVLSQTGISALAQANAVQQEVLKLLQ